MGDYNYEAEFAKLLDELAHSENPITRSNAASSLGQYRDPRAIELLIAAIDDPSADVRSNACGALGLIGATHEVGRLIEIVKLGNSNPNERWTSGAVWALGKLKEREAVEVLIERLNHPNQSMQMGVGYALGEIGDPRAVKPLIARLNDDNYFVRTEVAHALGMIGDPQAVEPLTNVLNDPYEMVRHWAAIALGLIRDKQAVPALIRALRRRDILVPAAAKALGEIRDRRALPPLIEFFEDEQLSNIREWGAIPIAKVGRKDEVAYEALMRGLNHKNPVLRIAAARALGYLGDPRAVPALEYAIKHDKGWHDELVISLRGTARQAIKRIKNRQAKLSNRGNK